jgi:hypothetical protein
MLGQFVTYGMGILGVQPGTARVEIQGPQRSSARTKVFWPRPLAPDLAVLADGAKDAAALPWPPAAIRLSQP